VLRILFGVTQQTKVGEESIVIQFMNHKKNQVKKLFLKIVQCIEDLNQRLKMVECVKIGILKLLINITTISKTNHSMICIQISVEIQIKRKQSGVIQQIKM